MGTRSPAPLPAADRVAATAALGVLLAAVVVATLPLTLTPWLVVRLWPGAGWAAQPQWWWLPAAAVVAPVVAFASTVVEATAAIVFPRPGQQPLLRVAGAAAEVGVLALAYGVVVAPASAALVAAAVAWAVTSLLEPALPAQVRPAR